MPRCHQEWLETGSSIPVPQTHLKASLPPGLPQTETRWESIGTPPIAGISGDLSSALPPPCLHRHSPMGSRLTREGRVPRCVATVSAPPWASHMLLLASGWPTAQGCQLRHPAKELDWHARPRAPRAHTLPPRWFLLNEGGGRRKERGEDGTALTWCSASGPLSLYPGLGSGWAACGRAERGQAGSRGGRMGPKPGCHRPAGSAQR